jgi:AraC family transcriptional regulator, arabinose operon regulatory protein
MDVLAENIYDPAMDRQESASPPPDLLVTGHFRERPPYAVYRSRGSGNWLITYTVAGHGLYRLPERTLETEGGDLVLLEPEAAHDYAAPPDGYWEFYWAHFHPRRAWLRWWRLPRMGYGLYQIKVVDPRVRTRIEAIFEQLHTDARAIDTGHLPTSESGVAGGLSAGEIGRELALNGLEEILLLATRDNQQQATRPVDGRVRRVLDAISADLAAPHTLESLAALIAISPSRLRHLFKDELGESVMSTLLRLRLRQAARLLEHTPRTIGAIAEEVGFQSPFYFSRRFSETFGLSPRAYRESVGGKRDG